MAKITFLGVGSAFSRKNATSCILVESEKVKLLVDCGAPILKTLGEYGLSLTDVTHLFVTHLHADHIGGLEEWAFQCRFEHGYRPTIISTASILNRLWHCSLKGAMEFVEVTPGDETPQVLSDYFKCAPVVPNAWFSLDPEDDLQIFIHSSHHVLGMESYALEISTEPRVPEKSVFFTSDVKFDESLVEMGLESCQLLLHDCQLFDSGENNKFGVHASYEQLLSLPTDVRKRLWLYHFGDTPLPDAKKDGFLGFVEPFQQFTL